MLHTVESKMIFLTARGRRMTLAEQCRLQGFRPFAGHSISRCALGGMLGNSMSCNVVCRLLAGALPSVGFDVRDNWDCNRASGEPSSDVRDKCGSADIAGEHDSARSLDSSSAMRCTERFCLLLLASVVGSATDFWYVCEAFCCWSGCHLFNSS